MDDLLQTQIRESCMLAFPNGLKDLMADISREVLRAQPQNLYQFIAKYLSALLVARENMNIAARVCDNVCASECCPELEDELRDVGMSDEDIEISMKIVKEYFEKGEGVNESTLVCKLMNKTELNETQLPKVLSAVRQSFLKHQLNKSTNFESSDTNSDMDETVAAAKHTLRIYRQATEPGKNYHIAAEKIQAAYRAYNLRRKQDPSAIREKSREKIDVTATGKAITFGKDDPRTEHCTPTLTFDRCVSKASSLSLAGSYVTLPPYKPYSANDISDVIENDEDDESENVTDYNAERNWEEQPGHSISEEYLRISNTHKLETLMGSRSEEIEIEEAASDEVTELAPMFKRKKRVSDLRSISFITLPKIIAFDVDPQISEEVDFEENKELDADVHEVEIRKQSYDTDDGHDSNAVNDNHSYSNSSFSDDISSGSSKGSLF